MTTASQLENSIAGIVALFTLALTIGRWLLIVLARLYGLDDAR